MKGFTPKIIGNHSRRFLKELGMFEAKCVSEKG